MKANALAVSYEKTTGNVIFKKFKQSYHRIGILTSARSSHGKFGRYLYVPN